ncbi:hypothetical protein [Peribacillus frigoritolerans]|uniref:hypothetical protein n=1 Tax=Peribacillus frigoritolerans TaxID=450367 RepID=UPI00105A9DD8|nr:hypothetical protein [Peribacillus frigoritolerans]TDL80932.1 hypothetical protein E2R53_13210 [Peribacillus frigoritolerans]
MVKRIGFGAVSFISLFGLAVGIDLIQGMEWSVFFKEAKFYFGTLKLDDYFSISIWLSLMIFYLIKVPNQQ